MGDRNGTGGRRIRGMPGFPPGTVAGQPSRDADPAARCAHPGPPRRSSHARRGAGAKEHRAGTERPDPDGRPADVLATRRPGRMECARGGTRALTPEGTGIYILRGCQLRHSRSAHSLLVGTSPMPSDLAMAPWSWGWEERRRLRSKRRNGDRNTPAGATPSYYPLTTIGVLNNTQGFGRGRPMEGWTQTLGTGPLLLIAAIAVAVLLILVIKFKVHAFLTLIIVSIATAFAAQIPPQALMDTLLSGFGETLASVALLIALGAMLGRLIEHSGGAQVLAEAMVRLFGEKRAPFGLGVASLLMGFPIFFDAGLVVMLPIIFAVARRLSNRVLLYGLPAAAAFSVMHV